MNTNIILCGDALEMLPGTNKCKQCKKAIERRGKRTPVFCSLTCKGEWQKSQKPADKAWLEQKYIKEGLSTYQISKIVNRNPKQVWHWLRGYQIPLRKHEWDTSLNEEIPYHNADWLREQYIDQGRTASEIAVQFNVTDCTIRYFLHRFNIPTRTTAETREKKYWGVNGERNPMYGRNGEANPRWRGGVSPERQAFYSSIEWTEAVKFVWKRDQGICQRCGAKPHSRSQFHIHHIISFAVRELRAEPTNLILLCATCHRWVHSNKNAKRDFIEERGM